MAGPGTVHSSRIEEAQRLRVQYSETKLSDRQGADQLLITRIQDIRWLTGFTGSNAVVIVGAKEVVLFTDGRYRTQAANETSVARVHIAESDIFVDLASVLERSVIFQSDHLTVSQKRKLVHLAPDTFFFGSDNLLAPFRAAKDECEIELIKKALSISEQTIQACINHVVAGITERDLAAEIDYQHARFGSEGPSFDTIVAFGERSALPHATPGDLELCDGDVILIDCGCKIGGYASDITRSFLFGTDSTEVRKVYSVVLDALDAAITTARSGMNASDLDHAARSTIESEGFGQYFAHSLGHGVGLEIHEMPRISQHSDQVLPENAIVTLEPGIYLPNRFGIRIEEMVLLRPEGAERLNSLTTEFSLI